MTENVWAKVNEMANEMSAFGAILSRVETMLEKMSGTMDEHHNGIAENAHKIDKIKYTWVVVVGVLSFIGLMVGIFWKAGLL